VSFAAITLCVASQRVIPKVSVYFVIDSVRKLLDTPLYRPFEFCNGKCKDMHFVCGFCNGNATVVRKWIIS
jgi:hypothetical protein